MTKGSMAPQQRVVHFASPRNYFVEEAVGPSAVHYPVAWDFHLLGRVGQMEACPIDCGINQGER